MRRSFGGGGRGMGGDGGMIRSVHRAVRAGVGGGAPPEPFSSSTTTATTNVANSRKTRNFNRKQPTSPNTALSLSSSSSSPIKLPLSAASGASAPTWGDYVDELDQWEYVDGSNEDERFYEDFVFGSVPSRDEVHHAVSALQQVLGTSTYTGFPKAKLGKDTPKDVGEEVMDLIRFEKIISSSESESEVDWIEPSLHLCNPRTLQARGSDRVYDAFRLLQTEPSVQRMVFSLSSDKAVWDAVLNNEVVKELRSSISEAGNRQGESSVEGSGDSNPVKDILSWIVVNAKAKIMQLIDNITKLVNGVFPPPDDDKKGGEAFNPLEEKLKTSLLLSVVVLLIVVVTRAQSA